MRATDILRAAIIPLTNPGVLFALLMFWLFVCLAAAAGMLGIWLALIIVPALFRYLTNLVETIGRNHKPQPPGVEFFRWVGDWWSMFPVVIVAGIAWASREILLLAGNVATLVFLLLMGFIYPAMLAVLSVTHSPVQTLNPVAIINMLRRVGASYLVAPLYLALIVYISTLIKDLPILAELLLELLLVFSLHAVIGQLMAPHGIFDDVHIPEPTEVGEERVSAELEKTRTDVLTHAYALISRGNRQGGFEHVFEWLKTDPDIVAAWAWYFERMLGWENKQHALFFAQHYIHDMFEHNEEIPALKAIMRCQLIDSTFKPLPEDRQAAIDAAERVGNNELAAVLRAG